MDSNSGGETWRPVTATRSGPKARRGLTLHLVDDAGAQRLLEGSGRERGQALDSFDGGVQDVRRIVLELGDRLLVHLQRLIRDEEEAEHARSLAEELDARLDERGGLG